jgi:hypothetical protein
VNAQSKLASTTALVIETNNLQGGDGENVLPSLARLLRHLSAQTVPLSDLAELVVTHSGVLDDGDRSGLVAAAGRDIAFVQIADDAGYYAAKELGFDATGAAIVAFADGDCWPDADWLEQLLAPFAGPFVEGDKRVDVVAGRTVYRADLLGIAATTIDFMYFSSPFGAESSRNFYANNVAFRRCVFDAVRYSDGDGFYRGNCQVAGIKLVERGVPVRFAPRARTTHRFPDSARELMQLRLLRGEDTVVLSSHVQSALPKEARFLLNLGAATPALILASRFACSVGALNHQDMPAVHGVRRAATVGLIAGLSFLDAVGAARGLRSRRREARQAHKKTVLSYHGDGDQLGA